MSTSFYEDASLVMIPSGYKTSKVYSAKPTDGAGDLVFSRSNDTATRVASNGLIEKVRTNIVLQSQTFDNASWTKSGSTVTANATTAPDGTTTADKLIENSSNSAHYVYSTNAASSTITTISVYAKKAERNFATIFLVNTAGSAAWFDLDSGVVGSKEGSVLSHSITSVGNGWYRCSATYSSVSSNDAAIGVSSANNTFSYLGNGTSGIFIWAAQGETGDIATDYILTTTAAVSVGPVANVPRLDYLNSSCPRLLLEPQATSLILFSEQMDNAAWTKGNVTVTANQSASPTGYSDADSLAEQAVNGIHYAGQAIASAAAGTYTFSCFLKQGTTQYGGFRAVVNGFTNRYFVLLDLSNGSVVNTNTTASGVTWTHKIDDYGNGWYRLSVTAAHTSGNIDISISTSDTATPTYFGGLPTYLGTNKFIYAWGANITATAYPQSYIPTLGAAVTRGADAASKTGISSLIGQTEGTLFVEFEVTHEMTGNNPLYTLSDGTTNNNIYANLFVSGGSNRVEFFVNNGGVAQVTANVLISNGSHKLAFAYKENDFIAFIDGVQVLVDTSGTVPATSRYGLGSWVNNALMYSDRIAQALLFKTRLSNADLAALTA